MLSRSHVHFFPGKTITEALISLPYYKPQIFRFSNESIIPHDGSKIPYKAFQICIICFSPTWLSFLNIYQNYRNVIFWIYHRRKFHSVLLLLKKYIFENVILQEFQVRIKSPGIFLITIEMIENRNRLEIFLLDQIPAHRRSFPWSDNSGLTFQLWVVLVSRARTMTLIPVFNRRFIFLELETCCHYGWFPYKINHFPMNWCCSIIYSYQALIDRRTWVNFLGKCH